MSDWTAGYMTNINYTFGYNAEMNPLRVKPALTVAGLACPEIKTACELGFGWGMNINFHAATSEVQWYGTDFNPSQADFAQKLRDAAGTDALLTDQSFEEFCVREDLPDFDYIALHGIWSWVSDNPPIFSCAQK